MDEVKEGGAGSEDGEDIAAGRAEAVEGLFLFLMVEHFDLKA